MPQTLGLKTVATYSSSAAEPPVPIVYRVIGAACGNWIHIERLGTKDYRWCVVWYRLENGQWRRIADVERPFETAESALDAVAVALQDPLNAGPHSTSAMTAGG
jgi:hypothetical protein